MSINKSMNSLDNLLRRCLACHAKLCVTQTTGSGGRENYVKVNGGEKVYSFTSPLIYLFALKFEYGDELLKQRVSCEIYSLFYFAGLTEKFTDHVIYL